MFYNPDIPVQSISTRNLLILAVIIPKHYSSHIHGHTYTQFSCIHPYTNVTAGQSARKQNKPNLIRYR